jgi:MFS family permease
MQLLAPDLLADVRELSVAVTAAGLGLGLLLWLLGWWGHRFWIVLGATVAGGVAGLTSSPDYGAQPLVAGLLAAVAAGVLALALVRVLAFAAGGLAASVLIHAFAPSWDQPLLTLLVGGLAGVFFFRLGMMALTSTAGTLLVLYCALSLLDRLGTLNAVPWADANAVLLNWLCGSGAILGVLAQFLLERRRLRKKREQEDAARQKAADEVVRKKTDAAARKKAAEDEKKKKNQPPPRNWWPPWGTRQAG